MKKLILFIILSVSCFFLFTINAQAACGVSVWLGNEALCLATDEYNKINNGTACVENRILTLNNYNGDKVMFTSGLGNPVNGNVIKLIGDNYITSEAGYGILHSVNGLTFIGDGTLTIKSKIPFVGADFDRNAQYNYDTTAAVSTIKIYAGNSINNDNKNDEVVENSDSKVEDGNEEIEKEDNNSEVNDDNTKVEKEDNNLLLIILGTISIISVLSLIVVVAVLLKRKN